MQKCAAVTTGNQRVWYYYCNRAGLYKPEGQGERQLKIQGTTKIGHQCSAYIKATENLVDKTVQVSYCSTHYNHSSKLAYLKIPERMRLEIAKKLQLGVTIDRILDDIRDNCNEGITREHLVTRLDVRNIKYQNNVEGIIRHKNDLDSVLAWINQMEENKEYNPCSVN